MKDPQSEDKASITLTEDCKEKKWGWGRMQVQYSASEKEKYEKLCLLSKGSGKVDNYYKQHLKGASTN